MFRGLVLENIVYTALLFVWNSLFISEEFVDH